MFITTVVWVSLAVVQTKISTVGMSDKLSECQGVILPANMFLLKTTVMVKHCNFPMRPFCPVSSNPQRLGAKLRQAYK